MDVQKRSTRDRTVRAGSSFVGAVSAAAIVAPPVNAAGAATSDQHAVIIPTIIDSQDITDTAQGREAIDSFIDRFDLPDTWRVRESIVVREDTLSTGEISLLVAPEGIEITSFVDERGFIVDESLLPEPGEESLFFDSGAPRPVVDSQVAAELFESAGLSAGLPGEVTTASVPTWNVMNQVCYARLTVDGTYTDACAVSYKLTNDTSQNFNFWGMRMYSTSGVLNPAFRLTRALIQARESAAGPNQSFVEWSPMGDTSGPCTGGYQVSAGVGAYGMSASISHTVGQRCETWDMTKGAVNDVNYALEWRGQVAADRGLGFVYTTRTPAAESGAANFIITYGVGGCVVIHC